MAVRGKFTVIERARFHWTPKTERVVLQPEYDSSVPEDQRYFDATPHGRIEMQINNPAALEQFTLGRKFYVDFNPVE